MEQIFLVALIATSTIMATIASFTPEFLPEFSDVNQNLMPSSRLDKIKSMYAWEGFVYALDSCPSLDQITTDFQRMKLLGARTMITFDICDDGKNVSVYEDVLSAAANTGIYAIPLAWTLAGDKETFQGDVVPRIEAVIQAVIQNPSSVLAVAMGDEPLYDNDFDSASNLAKYISQMKSNFSDAGLSDIPVSISEMAYGWQITKDFSSLVDVLDFFMINTFPYFASDAHSGGSNSSWRDFSGDIKYYESIAEGKPLMVTQTGWPSNKNTWSPNSDAVVTTVNSERGYWNLLDGHCEDFFKPKNIAWMWRSWDDSIDGWGAMFENGSAKWDVVAKTSC